MVFVSISVRRSTLISMKCTLLMLSNSYCEFILLTLEGG